MPRKKNGNGKKPKYGPPMPPGMRKARRAARKAAGVSRRQMLLAPRGAVAMGRGTSGYDGVAPPSKSRVGLQMRPMPTAADKQRVRLSWCEQLSAITTDGTGKATYALTIAPTTLASRNATFSTLFELCHIGKVVMRWIPNASVATPGSIVACVDYNYALGSFPTTLASASQREGALRRHVWEEFDHPVVWRDAIDKTATVSTASSTTHRPDGQRYTIGFVIEGAPASTLVGYVEIYSIYEYTGLKAYLAP